MPLETAKNGGKLVIVNLQATPLDKYALRINGMIDDVMIRLMAKLNLTIPNFTLIRRLKVLKTDKEENAKSTDSKNTKPTLIVRGVDETGSPYSVFKKIEVNFSVGKESFCKDKDPAMITPTKTDLKEGKAKMNFEFQGHYNEPNYTFELDLANLELGVPIYFLLEYDPMQGKWIRFEQTIIDA